MGRDILIRHRCPGSGTRVTRPPSPCAPFRSLFIGFPVGKRFSPSFYWSKVVPSDLDFQPRFDPKFLLPGLGAIAEVRMAAIRQIFLLFHWVQLSPIADWLSASGNGHHHHDQIRNVVTSEVWSAVPDRFGNKSSNVREAFCLLYGYVTWQGSSVNGAGRKTSTYGFLHAH